MILKLYDKNNNPHDLQRIVDLLQEGGLLIYPTDTLYAIGCSALAVRAVERICTIKKVDPRKNNLSVLCRDFSTYYHMAYTLRGQYRFLIGSPVPNPFRIENDYVRIEAGHKTALMLKAYALCRHVSHPAYGFFQA